MLHIAFLAITVLLLGELPAFAYVDPGTGSLLYQTALTALLGFGLVFRRVRCSVADLLRRIRGQAPASGSADPERH